MIFFHFDQVFNSTILSFRYDRFRNSEKTDEDDVSETEADKDADNKSETVEQNGAESVI